MRYYDLLVLKNFGKAKQPRFHMIFFTSSMQNSNSFFSLCRMSPKFQQVKVPVSPMSVFITKADDAEVVIEVNQPSDCLLLRREHVRCSEVNELTVWFGYKFIRRVNGPGQSQGPDKWKEALRYLLDTYRPYECYFRNGKLQTGINEGHMMELDNGMSYKTYWNLSKTVLTIRR